MITIPLTPEKFAAAMKGLQGAQGGDVRLTLSATPGAGSLATSQINLNFLYDYVSTLNVTVTSKHGLAKFASDGTIRQHLMDILDKVDA